MVASAADNLVFPYSTDPGNQNPKYDLIELVGGTQIFFFASNYMWKPMQERNDPRIPCYFEPGADGVYPVSYTHLDVYKRQVFTLLCPNSFCTVVILAPLYNNKVAFV